MEVAYRPSHADATYDFKYGIRAVAGGGRSSARETIGRVAAGAVAKKLLSQLCPGTEVRVAVTCFCQFCASSGARQLADSHSVVRCRCALPAPPSAMPPAPPCQRLAGMSAAAAQAAHAGILPARSLVCVQAPLSQLADPVLQVLAYVNKVQDVGSNVDHDTFTLEQVIGHSPLQSLPCTLPCHCEVLAGISGSKRRLEACDEAVMMCRWSRMP